MAVSLLTSTNTRVKSVIVLDVGENTTLHYFVTPFTYVDTGSLVQIVLWSESKASVGRLLPEIRFNMHQLIVIVLITHVFIVMSKNLPYVRTILGSSERHLFL